MTEVTSSPEDLAYNRDTESIRLTKTISGDYTWNIKIIASENIETQIDRLSQINDKLIEKFAAAIRSKKRGKND